MIHCPNKSHPDWKKLVENTGSENEAYKEYIVNNFTIPLDGEPLKGVKYILKGVDILLSDKAKQIFAKGEKAKWDLNKILTELAIPKEQKVLLLELNSKIHTVWHASDKPIDKFIKENVNNYFVKTKGGSPRAVFFTANKAPEESFLSKREYHKQFSVKMENPFIADYSENPQGEFNGKNREQIVREALENGHDGVIWKNIHDNGFVGDVYISLNADNISSDLREQLALELASKYGYSVEINTAKEQVKTGTKESQGSPTKYYSKSENRYYYYTDELGWISSDENNKNQDVDVKTPEDLEPIEFDTYTVDTFSELETQHYSNLTVPGGTNYTENEISTPLITPSIKGHAQFSTDKGIGWFRSDDKSFKIMGWQKDDVDWMDSESAVVNVIEPNDKIIFGHPTIGKTFLKKSGNNDFISLDDDYSQEIANFINKNKGNLDKYQYQENKPKEFIDFTLALYDRVKIDAKKQNKKLFTSNSIILENRMSDFDKVINLDSEEFFKRIAERNTTYDVKAWKSQIDNLISKVDSNKVITTKGYLSDLINPQIKTRRILEVQSDLFQKGRDKEDLILKQKEDSLYTGIKQETTQELYKEAKNKGKEVFAYHDYYYLYNNKYYSYSSINNKYYVSENNSKINTSENQFLQLLNKDNNWINFFVKSIIQSTAKQTITEVQESDVEAKVRELENNGLLKIKCD